MRLAKSKSYAGRQAWWYALFVAKRAYGQFCGFARALEVVGERWALLIVRDLLVAPKRFTDLHRGLPGIPTNILTARLKELEESGVVRRRVLPRPDGSVVYELTEHGKDLEDTVMALGRWGAKLLDNPRPGEVITVDSIVLALRTTFRPEAARGLRHSYELRMGDVVVHARIDEGILSVAAGPLPDADLTIEAGPAIKALLAQEISPADAIASGSVRVTGDARLLAQFAETFRI